MFTHPRRPWCWPASTDTHSVSLRAYVSVSSGEEEASGTTGIATVRLKLGAHVTVSQGNLAFQPPPAAFFMSLTPQASPWPSGLQVLALTPPLVTFKSRASTQPTARQFDCNFCAFVFSSSSRGVVGARSQNPKHKEKAVLLFLVLQHRVLAVADKYSQRSHLSSFTMKLMDKFHSPKIKRTPSKKGKPAEVSVKNPEKPVSKEATDRFLPEGCPLPLDLEQQTVEFMSTSAVASRSQRQKNLSWLEEKEKEVVSALRYFKTIVDKMAIDKKVLEMLPGSASKVLEAILPLVQSDPRIQHSSALSSCYNRVYQSLANLIRWSDQVMLEGVNSEDKETVTTVKGVIKAVLDGVKELVRLTIEKQGHPSPTSPVKPSSPACKPDGQSELPLTDREMEILNKTTGLSQSAELLPDSTDEEVAPPKPPLPGIRVVDNSPPPALPPKKRQSAPSPTRVAVVAPMSRATSGSSLPVGINRQDFDVDCYTQRRLSGGSHSYGGESPRLSPCSSIGKLSKSDEQLSSLDRDSGQCSRNTSCETLDHYDPDYEFLQQDLSNTDQIPQPVACHLSPLPESLGESGSPFLGCPFQLPPAPSSCPQPDGPLAPGQQVDTPPALPEKKRRSAASQTTDSSGCRVSYERHPSQYDNISEDDLQNPASGPSVPFTPFAAILPFQQGGSSASVEFVGDFAVPESTGDPEKPPPLPEKKNKHMLAYMQLLEDYSEPQPSMFYQTPQNEHIYQQKNKMLMEVYGFNDSFSTEASQELAPPPALPPKQRQLESPAMKDGHPRDPSSASSAAGKESRDGDRASRSPDGSELARSEEEVDELSLIDHNEIMARLTLKQEGDDGPDVRGGSGDILLVHATETDRKDLVLYCEAFLTTYRTFITPEELIKKLQYRYEKFSPFADTFKKRVSKNTFFVLVRVVDELCLVELTEEILKLLMELVFRLVCNGELSLARVLRKNILDKVDQKKLLRCANSDQPLAARGVAARPGTLHDFHSHEIAEQLTLLDAELFYKIEIPEVLLWAKEQNEEKSPNLTQFTEHFNNMSYWVRSIIMLQEKAQDRERLLLKFIKIMKHLRKLNNFNSYLAILSALDSAPIRRLEWQKQTSEGLAEYCTLIDSSSSFRAYRAALSEVEPPCIPYLGLILQDLTFVHLGNPDYIDGKVNFSKRWQQFNILDSMRCFQQAHYDIRRNDDIINFFNDFSDHLAEEALWELSLKIKPRNITRRKTDREEKT
ncbi:rap guanine nucleotide exchange factor 1 isoform X13 [Mirounga leonina]|uniref:rap guanine nucleotide exchange factor 1 isoform X13 n=1 Tax=Mirounga leonina TaxID=9715 RepID=UPI00156BE046|nr:rap guanine nucleotide exchange factor 1 isoform X13 [Mirounga leonina]